MLLAKFVRAMKGARQLRNSANRAQLYNVGERA
jgi:hypothetical protein